MNKELRAALLAQVETRQKLNALAVDAPAEERAAAVAAFNDAEQAVAELLAKDEPSEAPPELRDQISLGRYMRGIAEERALDGPEGELRAELKLSDEAVPLEALLPTPEERADAVSPQTGAGAALPPGTINRTTGQLLTRVFTMTDGAFLGVPMPTVPAGMRRYPVMVDGTDASMQARGAGPDAKAAEFDVQDVTPKRLTGRYVFDLEGVAEMGGLLESTLRSDLRTVMGYQMDRQMLLGDGTGNNVSGILEELDLEAQPGSVFSNNDPSLLTWELCKQLAYGSLDGQYLRMESDMRLLVGKASYDLMKQVYFEDNNVSRAEEDGTDIIRRQGVALRPSYQIPAPAVAKVPPKTANSSKKIQNAVLTTMPSDAVMPVWQGMTMIRDPYTNAKGAQVILTAHMLFGFIFRRKNAWKRYAIRTES